jgi:hypothetical protein
VKRDAQTDRCLSRSVVNKAVVILSLWMLIAAPSYASWLGGLSKLFHGASKADKVRAAVKSTKIWTKADDPLLFARIESLISPADFRIYNPSGKLLSRHASEILKDLERNPELVGFKASVELNVWTKAIESRSSTVSRDVIRSAVNAEIARAKKATWVFDFTKGTLEIRDFRLLNGSGKASIDIYKWIQRGLAAGGIITIGDNLASSTEP